MKLESFSAILSDCTSKYNKIKKEEYLHEGQFPIIDQGQKFVGGFTDDGKLITAIEKELIIFGDHTKILKFIDFPIAIGADGVKVLHVNKEKADPRYIYYFLKSVKLTDAGYSRHFKFLKEIKIPVPKNIDDQIKIARVLSHVETLINQRKESILLLDELLRCTFLEMFGDPIKNEKNWEKLPLEKITSKIGSGSTPRGGKETYLENGISLIRSLNIYDNEFKYNNLAFISELQAEKLNNVIVEKEDVLFNITGASVCRCTVVPKDVLPARVNQHVSILRPIPEMLNSKYLSNYLISENIKIQLLGASSSGGAVMEAITKEKLEKFKIPVPPIDLQNYFALKVEKVEYLRKQFQVSLKELENMLGALSQEAFSMNLEEIKKKDEEVMEQDNLEQYSKNVELKKEKVDITKMSFGEYYKIPEEVIFKNEKWISYFLHDDLLYQFLLKDNFKDVSFTFGNIENQLHSFFYHTCDMDYDNEKWKEIIFKFLEANPPLIVQEFDQDDKIIKLKLTDEAFKA